jgi:uncharacterized protein YkwD
MSHNEQEQRGRSGWLLLLVPLIATLAAGGYVGRSYFDGSSPASSQLASTGSSATPASAPAATPAASATGDPQTADPQAGADAPGAVPGGASTVSNVNLGRISGKYLLKGPARAPAGSVVVFVVRGPKQAVHTDATAPFTFTVDAARIPNGTYTVSVTVIRPGLPALSQNRLMEVANPAAVTPKPASGGKPSASAPATVPPASAAGSSGSGLSAQAASVLKLTNAERAKAGCKPLTSNAKLTSAAQAHSADMAKNDYFAHESQNGDTPFDRIKSLGYSFRAAAENIAYGQTSAASVMDAWMNSSGHKANILNCTYTQIGIGYALRGQTPYWTQDFGTPM